MSSWQFIKSSIDFNSSLDLVSKNIVNIIKDFLKIDACSIFIAEDEENFTLVSSTLAPDLPAYSFFININSDILGNCIKREESLLIENIRGKKNFNLNNITRIFYKKAFAIPIIQRSKVIAVLVAQNIKENITDNTQSNLITICSNISYELLNTIKKDDANDLGKDIIINNQMTILKGVGLSENANFGRVILGYNVNDISSILEKPCQSDDEVNEFNLAVSNVKKKLKLIANNVKKNASENEASLFDFYLQVLQSGRFCEDIIKQIEKNIWVQTAIKNTVLKNVEKFSTMNDVYFKERAIDIQDLGKRIIIELENLKKEHKKKVYHENSILMCHEVTASMLAEIPKEKLKGIVSEKGNQNSHAAILARALDIPMVANLTNLPLNYLENREVIVDGYDGKVLINPHFRVKEAYKKLINNEKKLLNKISSALNLESKTLDGTYISLNSNIGLLQDLKKAKTNNADSVGLYRSEILFMVQDNFPNEDVQTLVYEKVLNSFPNKYNSLRTLDIGADKSLPYFYAKEENPALGWRGIRMMLDQSNLFLTQLRAMIKASENKDNLKITLPMITEVNEIKEAISLIKQSYKELLNEGFNVKYPKIGVMIEVPSIIFQLPFIIKYVDYISIGTNDLTQYILATDRNNEKISHLYCQTHPSIIYALHRIIEICKNSNIEISVCGEVANSSLAIPLLIGLGFRNFSMNSVSILRIKWIIRHINIKQCQELTKEILKIHDKNEIRKKLYDFLVLNKLGGLVRIGNV